MRVGFCQISNLGYVNASVLAVQLLTLETVSAFSLRREKAKSNVNTHYSNHKVRHYSMHAPKMVCFDKSKRSCSPHQQ